MFANMKFLLIPKHRAVRYTSIFVHVCFSPFTIVCTIYNMLVSMNMLY